VMLPRVRDVADRHAKMLSELAKLAVASTAATVVVWLLSLMGTSKNSCFFRPVRI